MIPDASNENWRTLPEYQRFLLLSEAYWLAAERIETAYEHGKSRTEELFPAFYLYNHSIELFLKAALRFAKVPSFGHDLHSLWTDVMKAFPGEGSKVSIFVQVTFYWASQDKKNLNFRYPKDQEFEINENPSEHKVMISEVRRWMLDFTERRIQFPVVTYFQK